MGSVGVSFFPIYFLVDFLFFLSLGVFCHSVLLMDGTYEVKIVRGVENGRRDIHTLPYILFAVLSHLTCLPT